MRAAMASSRAPEPTVPAALVLAVARARGGAISERADKTEDFGHDETAPVPFHDLEVALAGAPEASPAAVVAHLNDDDLLGLASRLLRADGTLLGAYRALFAAATPLFPGAQISEKAAVFTIAGLSAEAPHAPLREALLRWVPTLFATKAVREGDTLRFPVSFGRPAAFAGAGLAVALVAIPTHLPVFALAFPAGLALAFLDRKRDADGRARHQEALRRKAFERELVLRDRPQKPKEKRATARVSLVPEAVERALGDFEGATVAGLYRVGPRLASGASGVVHRGVRITDDRPIALKLLRIAAAHDGLAADRLRREAEALGLAWHPNVVEVVDHGRLPDGTTFLVLELLDGETLEARLRRGPLPLVEILKFSQALAEALIAIHAAGVVHRDLSPNNLFFARGPGPETTLKVLDFGIARVEWEELRITQTGVTLGTPGFIAPEQVAGEPVDARADLYAVGACLYAAAVGSAPPADPRARLPVPVPLQSLVDALLAADPGSRPRDARAVRDALRALRSTNASVREAGDGAELSTNASVREVGDGAELSTNASVREAGDGAELSTNASVREATNAQK
jgi:hypothetical protein